MERIDAGGLTVAYERRGSGPSLVLLHGGMSDRREWERQLDGLSDDFTVVAWDAPGHGGSSDPPPGFGFAEYADILAAFIATLDLGPAHVGGLSWGSVLALKLYARHPDAVRSLVLVGAYAGWAGSLTPEEVAARLAGVKAQMSRPPRQWAEEWLPTLLTPHATREVVEHLTTIIGDARPMAVAGLEAMAREDLRPMLSTITVPTLLLYGEADVRSPATVAEALHRSITGSTLVYVPGAGHQVNLEAPRRFNEEVLAFLAGSSRA